MITQQDTLVMITTHKVDNFDNSINISSHYELLDTPYRHNLYCKVVNGDNIARKIDIFVHSRMAGMRSIIILTIYFYTGHT